MSPIALSQQAADDLEQVFAYYFDVSDLALAERFRDRKALLGARLMAVRGRWEQVDGVEHLIARRLEDFSHLLGELQTSSRDFH